MGSNLKTLVAVLVATLVGMLPAWVNQIDFGLVASLVAGAVPMVLLTLVTLFRGCSR